MAPSEEMPYAVVDVIVDRLIRLPPRAVAEVCGPAFQHLIQPIPYLRPRSDVVGCQKISHSLLDARYALLRRTGSCIPTAILRVAVWTERITQKVEAFLAGLFDASFCLIQSES